MIRCIRPTGFVTVLGAFVGCADPSQPMLFEGGDDGSPVAGHCSDTDDRNDPFVDCIESFEPDPSATFGHDALPDVVLGPPLPEGAGGSTDVASLGCGGRITVYFADDGIVDSPGPDLIVFENAFATGQTTFAEPARVLASLDGMQWAEFPCDIDTDWPPHGCAGVTPTAIDADATTATDPKRSGGDAFDLDDVGLAQARYVRLVDVTEEFYGDRMWCEGGAGGFDLDAMAVTETSG